MPARGIYSAGVHQRNGIFINLHQINIARSFFDEDERKNRNMEANEEMTASMTPNDASKQFDP